MRRNTINDEEFARQQQQRLYSESPTDIDDSPLTNTQLDHDAAYALQLQTGEYSKTSLPSAPSHSYFSSEQESNDSIYPAFYMNPDDPIVVSDAELAAHLGAEEKLQQCKQTSQRRPTPAVRHSASNVTRTSTLNTSSNNGSNPVISAISMLLQPFTARNHVQTINDHFNDPVAEDLLSLDGDFGPEDYERLLELDKLTTANKLTEEQISTLPTEKYHRTANQSEEETKCNICIEQFQPQQTLRRLTCFHVYHQDCIDPWLKENNICPICRIPPIK
ncbi:unnamed protein product [Rotaria sp. Silwood2]|nr:unnamed protein product [Rotaria sp. Silwood2]CAF2945534.1 unnamed protein product [Rotaria sp. Silwood2]CAF3172876.1 unnamed protein product [Rotaria sp. Silwood2]CAF3325485.1 unnamed protein product [Rotaria sp. Silwood2]CAF3932812.1 unnamed protein product [Rotaria sp. Silwood2]